MSIVLTGIKPTEMQVKVIDWSECSGGKLFILNGMGAGSTTALEFVKHIHNLKKFVFLDGYAQILEYLQKHKTFDDKLNYIMVCYPQQFVTFADKVKGKYSVISGYSVQDNPYLDDNYKNALLDIVSRKKWS